MNVKQLRNVVVSGVGIFLFERRPNCSGFLLDESPLICEGLHNVCQMSSIMKMKDDIPCMTGWP